MLPLPNSSGRADWSPSRGLSMNGMPDIQLPRWGSPFPARSFWRPAKFHMKYLQYMWFIW